MQIATFEKAYGKKKGQALKLSNDIQIAKKKLIEQRTQLKTQNEKFDKLLTKAKEFVAERNALREEKADLQRKVENISRMYKELRAKTSRRASNGNNNNNNNNNNINDEFDSLSMVSHLSNSTTGSGRTNATRTSRASRATRTPRPTRATTSTRQPSNSNRQSQTRAPRSRSRASPERRERSQQRPVSTTRGGGGGRRVNDTQSISNLSGIGIGDSGDNDNNNNDNRSTNRNRSSRDQLTGQKRSRRRSDMSAPPAKHPRVAKQPTTPDVNVKLIFLFYNLNAMSPIFNCLFNKFNLKNVIC